MKHLLFFCVYYIIYFQFIIKKYSSVILLSRLDRKIRRQYSGQGPALDSHAFQYEKPCKAFIPQALRGFFICTDRSTPRDAIGAAFNKIF